MGKNFVGTLALTADYKAAFQYAQEWLENGFSISPFSLPLKTRYLFQRKIIFQAFLEYLQIVFQTIGEDFCWID